jgi:hypothetical protein
VEEQRSVLLRNRVIRFADRTRHPRTLARHSQRPRISTKALSPLVTPQPRRSDNPQFLLDLKLT